MAMIDCNNPFWIELRCTDAERLLSADEYMERHVKPAFHILWSKISHINEAEMIAQELRDLGLDPR